MALAFQRAPHPAHPESSGQGGPVLFLPQLLHVLALHMKQAGPKLANAAGVLRILDTNLDLVLCKFM